jgi:D-glycero-D-manno-heptose 1,7-bisphosphate phosphatase
MRTIFLDRDGVINKDPGGWTEHDYVTRWEDFHFIPGSLEALKMLNSKGIDVIVISNQAGVGKGYFTQGQLDEVNEKMLKAIDEFGGHIKKVYYCIHKKEDNCACRKPKAGLLEEAIKKYRVDISNAYFIGDSYRDIFAGKSVGIKTIFVLSGKESQEEMERMGQKPDHIFKDLLEAVKWVIKKEAV